MTTARATFAALGRRLARLFGRPWRPVIETDWNARAQRFGRRAVLNLRDATVTYTAATETQRQAIFPALRATLRGDERVILDLGCGPGRFTPDLAGLVTGFAIGLDPTEPLLVLAPAAPRVLYLRATGNQIPLVSASVDVVWICLVLGGLRDAVLAQTVAEVQRVLKPHALLCLVENTTEARSPAHWEFRPVDVYRGLFPSVELRHEGDYSDSHERHSILIGRRRL